MYFQQILYLLGVNKYYGYGYGYGYGSGYGYCLSNVDHLTPIEYT